MYQHAWLNEMPNGTKLPVGTLLDRDGSKEYRVGMGMTGRDVESNDGARITVSNRQKIIPVDKAILRKLVRFVAEQEGCDIVSIDVAIVSADEIERLNREYLGREGITDVMSFDLSEPGSAGLDGQIVICADAAATQGRRYGLSIQEEMMLYVIHGLLHLAGYDDTSEALAGKMRTRQGEILRNFKKLFLEDQNR